MIAITHRRRCTTGYSVEAARPKPITISKKRPALLVGPGSPVAINHERINPFPLVKLEKKVEPRTSELKHNFASLLGVDKDVLNDAYNQLRNVVESKYNSGEEYLSDPGRISKELQFIRSLFPLGMDVLYTSFLECWILSSVFPLSSLSLMDVYLESTKLEEPIRKTLFAKLKDEGPALFVETLKKAGYQKINLGPMTNSVQIASSKLGVDNVKIDEEFLVISPSSHLGSLGGSGIGFLLFENFLSLDEMVALMKCIDCDDSAWAADMEHKRVQVFGYNYLNPEAVSKPIPTYFQFLLDRLRDRKLGSYDQLIISDYPPGIGLQAHVDRLYWDERIIGISLLSPCTMTLTSLSSSASHSHELGVGSLYVLEGQSRYSYSHAIAAETVVDRRVSLTFRNLAVKPAGLPEEVAKRLKFEL